MSKVFKLKSSNEKFTSGGKADLSRHNKESENLKVDKLTFSSLRNKKKENEEKGTDSEAFEHLQT